MAIADDDVIAVGSDSDFGELPAKGQESHSSIQGVVLLPSTPVESRTAIGTNNTGLLLRPPSPELHIVSEKPGTASAEVQYVCREVCTRDRCSANSSKQELVDQDFQVALRLQQREIEMAHETLTLTGANSDDGVGPFISDGSTQPTLDMDLQMAEAMQIDELIKAGESVAPISSAGTIIDSATLKSILRNPKKCAAPKEFDPNVFDLGERFTDYDYRYFNTVLTSFNVTVEWSNQMTLCAGICYFKPQATSCTIRLSEPLLRLRPISDSVDTLLHEMIHAYLFLTGGNQGRDGHGEDFVRHMDRINKSAGTKITVYHSFRSEVLHYKNHVWRCNGPCREKPPYFGWVRRARNRRPQKADFWFERHQRECGGSFQKISEPDHKNEPGKGKLRRRNRSTGNKPGNSRITRFFESGKLGETGDGLTGPSRNAPPPGSRASNPKRRSPDEGIGRSPVSVPGRPLKRWKQATGSQVVQDDMDTQSAEPTWEVDNAAARKTNKQERPPSATGNHLTGRGDGHVDAPGTERHKVAEAALRRFENSKILHTRDDRARDSGGRTPGALDEDVIPRRRPA